MREKTICSARRVFFDGMRDGLPIGLGYFAVSFSLGIVAKNAGINALQGFLMSLLNNASAGEYAGIMTISALAPYGEIALITLITNARYLLMSCALSQRISPQTPFFHRLILGFDITDEIFGITVAREGFINPFYTYGAMVTSIPFWAVGTSLGILAGEILPLRIVSALGVALYGMFLAVIIPPAKKDKVVASLVVVSFAVSYIFSKIPMLSGISGGTKTIILTVLIAGLAAILFPVKEEN